MYWIEYQQADLFLSSTIKVFTEILQSLGMMYELALNVLLERDTIWGVAVVEANSFINTDVPAFAIVVGSPARLIRYRFSEPTMAAITASSWWNLSLDSAKLLVRELEALVAK